MVTEDLAEQMNMTSQAVNCDVYEFNLANLTPIDSLKIKPKRVKESKITFECEMVHYYFLENYKNGSACIVTGRL
ncbi:hypothetical protein [Flavobacterium sp.]|uniref:hypothetical protein n=1 Tax=Flavobacterium sp. TaxID=239 RepID=UPI00375101DC